MGAETAGRRYFEQAAEAGAVAGRNSAAVGSDDRADGAERSVEHGDVAEIPGAAKVNE